MALSAQPGTGHLGDAGFLDAMTEPAARSLLQSCLAVPRWVDEVLEGRPYGSGADLLARAGAAASTLTEPEVAAALARHPRIGERAGAGHDAELSAREQSAVDPDDAALGAALAQGNADYERKFDRVFLIRAAGRSSDDILDALRRRLTNSPEAELAEVVTQLREIALLRLTESAGSTTA